jgi:hypothetical protein
MKKLAFWYVRFLLNFGLLLLVKYLSGWETAVFYALAYIMSNQETK